MKKLFILLTILSALCVSTVSFAQTSQVAGKIFPSSQAVGLLGPVTSSFSINVPLLKSIAVQTPHYIMLGVIKNQLIILDNKRNVLYPKGAVISSSDVFHVFSTSLLLQLLADGTSQVASVDMRNSVLSVTNGATTMEYSFLCPPFCNWD
jgi:hypothetical protein